MKGSATLLALSYLLHITTISSAIDTISSSQSIEGNQTLVSADGSFELGFFSGDNPNRRYLGIWYKKLPTMTVVWVANREVPLTNSSGTLNFTDIGVLALLDHNNTVVWSLRAFRTVQNPIAQLLSTGNLVVRAENDNDPENFLWQSFDYPSDTFLPGFKLGRVIATGFDRFLTSWKTPGDPSPGDYTYRLNPNGYPQLLVSQGTAVKFSTGPWNGLRFSGTPNLNKNPIYDYGFVLNDMEMYYSYELLNSSILSRMILSANGIIERYVWIDRTQGWKIYLTEPIDSCDTYGLCGSYGSCNVVNSPVCQCMKGFVPRVVQEWERMDWSSGCARRTSLNCSEDIFLKYSPIKLPDTQSSWYSTTMNLEECKATCEDNCTCTAYATLNIREGNGCLLWFGDLVDVREYSENGQDLYVRMAASEAGILKSERNQKKRLIIILSSVAGMLIFAIGVIMYILYKKGLCRQVAKVYISGGSSTENRKECLQLPLFAFLTVADAANNFSDENKLGEGGFGPVYKGVLKDGQEIAVKKLSSNSNQGINEFENEVSCIAKLQHRNLVRLLGYCIEEEMMLLYEYMPNKSLDFFIFDDEQRKRLNWDMRFNIIYGIAKGLLYLHQDSRLRVIHRDLKASNVLLDREMNPKISDFGTARSFGGNETEAITDKVVGTYGYMSPEYAIDGNFSTKSDVFSFGVLLLEIIAGRKNRGFYHPDHRLNLLGHAWKLFNEGRTSELIDESIVGPYNLFEALRSIHVGLLCVQRSPEDRPSMAYVVLMLTSDITLPRPKEPGFFNERELFPQMDPLLCIQALCDNDKMTATMLNDQ